MATLRFSIRSDRCPRDLYGHVGREFKLRPFSAGSNLDVAKHYRAACFHDRGGANAAEDTINKTHAVNN